MRNIINSIIVAGLSIAAAIMPTAASAQSLDQILGVVSAGSAFGYNSCSYVRGGVQSIACQANRASNVARTLRSVQQNSAMRNRQQFDQRTRQLVALQRACKAGDEQSCDRSGGTDPRAMAIARELMNACTAGDRQSCRRADAILSGRDDRSRAYASNDRGYDRDDRYASYDERYDRDRQIDRDYPSMSSWGTDDLRQPRAAQHDCRVLDGPHSGYRLAGQLDCR